MLVKINSWGYLKNNVYSSDLPSMGLSTVKLDKLVLWKHDNSQAIYEIIDKEIFFLAVIQHGLQFVEVGTIYANTN